MEKLLVTEIINGKLIYNEMTSNANGGTELMARRMVRDIDPSLLEGVQIIHSRVRELKPDLKKILVCHDLANDPEVAKLADVSYRKQFDKIVFVSHWQQHTYNMVLGVPFKQSVVIRNGIEPFTNETVKDVSGPIKLIYHTTPHRGLELLVPAFKFLRQNGYDIELDVYSSFNIYGWGERDKQYSKLFEEIDKTEGIRNHGTVSNEEIREALEKSHIFAYPNIWPETSCLALIEAMCAGNCCLHSNLGALPETSKGLSLTYMYSEDVNEHLNTFTLNLKTLIDNIKYVNRINTGYQMIHSNSIYNWNVIKFEWESLLRTIKNESGK